MKTIWEEFRMILALNLLSLTITLVPKNRAGLEIIVAIRNVVKRHIDRQTGKNSIFGV